MRRVEPTKDRWRGPPGTWFPVTRADGRSSAMLNCSGCGRTASLGDHEIAANGAVSPSVVCPFACGFHEFIQLRGWGEK